MKAMRSPMLGLVDLVGGGLEGPVDEHGAADDVFARDKAPEAAVEDFGAVVAHGEDGCREERRGRHRRCGWEDRTAQRGG